MSAPETCPERVWRGGDWNGHHATCGKPIKRNGLCGVHANTHDRREQRDNESRERSRVAAEARALAARIAAAGVPCYGDGYGRVTFELEAARTLADRLEQ